MKCFVWMRSALWFCLLLNVGLTQGAVSQPFELPQLLEDPGQDLAYVCRNSSAPLAGVAWKTHFCDNMPVKQCMELSRTLSDPCNTSLKSEVSLFHFRVGHYEDFDQGDFISSRHRAEVINLWTSLLSKSGMPAIPGLILVDTKNCAIVGHVFLYNFPNQGSRWERAQKTNDLIKQTLPTALQGKFSSALDRTSFDLCTLSAESPSLRQVWESMNEQVGRSIPN